MAYTFNHRKSTPLCEIMGRNKSDKGAANITASWHNYTTLYYYLFKNIREQQVRVFELGLGTNNVNLPSNMGAKGRPGAPLYGWAEFFPNADIYGADIDRDILFNTQKIHTYYCDQTNPDEIARMWAHPELQEEFDIIIEDGLHTYAANVCFFENSIQKLRIGGYYIIEDIDKKYIQLFTEKITQWKSMYPSYTFDLIKIPSSRNQHDNTVIVVKRVE